MIGQEKIVNEINNLTLDTFTTPIIFIAPRGCGKKTITKCLANKLSLDIIYINSDIDDDLLIEYRQKPIKTLYYIDLADFNIKQQNKLLKFIEEPSKNCYIVIGNTSEATTLETILNRCVKYNFISYSVEELMRITNTKSELVCKIIQSPGQILNTSESQLNELIKFCTFFKDNFMSASSTKLLSCVSKFNYNDNYNKFDFYNFFTVLNYITLEDYINNTNINSYKLYTFTQNKIKELQSNSISKENFMINYLLSIKEVII